MDVFSRDDYHDEMTAEEAEYFSDSRSSSGRPAFSIMK